VYTPDRQKAIALDDADPLGAFARRFVAPPEGVIYLDGNSLGQLPLQTRDALHHAVDHEWGQRLIRSWSEGWMELPSTIGDRLATSMLGAAAGQTVLADSTTVCFYKLAAGALTARPGRTRILTDAANFPTDRYVLEALADARGMQIDWLQTDPAGGPEPDQVAALLSEETALVTFSHVDYRSAHIADLPVITELAHDHGALMLWDLSHSAGIVPLSLDADHVDLAVGCTYKYLNGGPGSPAYLYVNSSLSDDLRQPIWGWIGRRDRFAMAPGYEPADAIGQMLSGKATIDAIRAKSLALTAYAIELADPLPGIDVGSPRDPARRGGHVALTHPDAERLTRTLAEDHGVIADFRAPDVIRLGLSPLTTRFIDVHDAVARLSAALG
jgi:kynureninase